MSKKPKKENVDFILFAIKQAKKAQAFGFTRNHCCRNLKTALIVYWQSKTLGIRALSKKKLIPRSKAAQKKPLNECVVEHVVPLMVFVHKLMDMKSPTKPAIIKLLKSGYRVSLVTHAEHKRLTKLKLRYEMPPEWDGSDIYARYKAAGIKVRTTATDA